MDDLIAIEIELLRMAERRVSQGRALVERQRNFSTRLEPNGKWTGQAKALLSTFEETQALHESRCDRLLANLASLLRNHREAAETPLPYEPVIADRHLLSRGNDQPARTYRCAKVAE
jgi:hypothetical protein